MRRLWVVRLVRFWLRRAIVFWPPLRIALRFLRLRIAVWGIILRRFSLRHAHVRPPLLRLPAFLLPSLVRAADGMLRRRLRVALWISAVLFRPLSEQRMRTLWPILRLRLRWPRHVFLRPVVRVGLRPRVWLRNAGLWFLRTGWRLRPRIARADLRPGPLGPAAAFVQQ